MCEMPAADILVRLEAVFHERLYYEGVHMFLVAVTWPRREGDACQEGARALRRLIEKKLGK